MSTMINIEELHRNQEKRGESNEKVYQEVLKKIHQVIIITSKTTPNKFCFYLVPTYIYGLPLFNINECIIYLVAKLSENGFDVRYTHPNLLLISWLVKPNKESKKKYQDNQKKALGYKPIGDYQPTRHIVDNNSLNALQEKANRLLYNSL